MFTDENAGGLRPFETWAREQGVDSWLLAAARAQRGWPDGQEVTEESFEAAIEAVRAIEVR